DGIIAPEFRDIDMAIASENILLELEALGLGGVMIGVSPIKENMEHVRDALKMKDELIPFTIIPFGYPEKRRPLEDRYDVSRIHYIK
ncbi:MAG: nitroreductase family protein, partial [Schwartzia sp.]|nr:nitroreductase family protein [Schwartzia sp. (in: firmicutes)]